MATSGSCDRVQLAARLLDALVQGDGVDGHRRALAVLRDELAAHTTLLAIKRPWMQEEKGALWESGLPEQFSERLQLAMSLAAHHQPLLLREAELPASLRAQVPEATCLALAPICVDHELLGTLGALYTNTEPGQEVLGDLQVAAHPLALSLGKVVAVERLRVSQRLYKHLVEGVNSIILRLDVSGNICFINHYGAHYFGYDAKELKGKNVVGTIVDQLEDFEQEMSRLMDDVQQHPDRYLHSEMEHRRSDGSKAWVRWSNRPVLSEQGELLEILSVGDDISERKKLEGELVELATTDSLTRAFNRRKLLAELSREVARAARHGGPFSLLMIDLDHFKQVNDQHGHDVGDAVLVHLVEHFRRELREQDLIGRLGGEEFAVLLPETRAAAAFRVAERLRRFEGAEAPPVPYTFSAGVAQWRPGEDAGDLLKRADDALYRAKAEGRDRVMREEEQP